jgi:hypothetical protein
MTSSFFIVNRELSADGQTLAVQFDGLGVNLTLVPLDTTNTRQQVSSLLHYVADPAYLTRLCHFILVVDITGWPQYHNSSQRFPRRSSSSVPRLRHWG